MVVEPKYLAKEVIIHPIIIWEGDWILRELNILDHLGTYLLIYMTTASLFAQKKHTPAATVFWIHENCGTGLSGQLFAKKTAKGMVPLGLVIKKRCGVCIPQSTPLSKLSKSAPTRWPAFVERCRKMKLAQVSSWLRQRSGKKQLAQSAWTALLQLQKPSECFTMKCWRKQNSNKSN